MQTDTPRLARICYRVSQSGQKHLLKKNAVTAHTHVFRFCSNSPLLFARHVSVLMLHYPQGDIQQLSSTTTRNISLQVRDFQEVQKFPIDFPAVKICGHRQKSSFNIRTNILAKCKNPLTPQLSRWMWPMVDAWGIV